VIRVLMTTDTVGGVWTYACELARALAPHGVEIALATMGAPLTTSQAREAARLSNVAVEESAFALEWMPAPWREVDAASDWLLGIAGRYRPQLVHVNGYAHAALPFGVPVICVAHSCVLTWSRAVRGRAAGPEWAEYRRRTGAGLRAAAEIVAPTAAILRAILDAHGVVNRNRVIPNGRAIAPRTAYPKEPFVLGAGRLWDEAKGLRELVACADRVPWPIRVAGPIVAPGGAGDRAAKRQIDWLGELAPDALADWMARAAIYALPARYEPFGLSILEAALARCALVVGDLATLRELWGASAIYVPPGDPEALASALTLLARDPAQREALASAAHARAVALTPDAMALAYRALYDDHLGTHQELSA
jgi:glycogen synthase